MARSYYKGWLITAIGSCINACFLIYSWSIIKGEIKKSIEAGDPEWNWNVKHLNAPYGVALLVNASVSYLAGYWYDKVGPRIVMSIGGVLVFLGMFTCSLSSSLTVWIIGFSIMSCGNGTCYTTATPMCLKWFPSTKAGLIAAIVQGGAAISAIYLSPVLLLMINTCGILSTMRLLSVAYLVVIVGLAQFLQAPPSEAEGDKVKLAQPVPRESSHGSVGPTLDMLTATDDDFTFSEAVRTRSMWQCSLGLFLGGGTGLMLIAEGTALANQALGEKAWLSVVVISLANWCGKLSGGIMNDKIGLRKALLFSFTFQALTMVGLTLVRQDSVVGIVSILTSIGFNYGAQPCLWSVAAKFLFGMKAYGQIMGVIVLGWGLGGLVLSNVGHILNESTDSVYAIAILGLVLLLIGDFLVLFLAIPNKAETDDLSSQLADRADSS
jgi:MFS family permease